MTLGFQCGSLLKYRSAPFDCSTGVKSTAVIVVGMMVWISVTTCSASPGSVNASSGGTSQIRHSTFGVHTPKRVHPSAFHFDSNAS